MATIRDVAQTAGVSTTTVSRYLNKRIELPAATAVRIDAAIARHDYRPNVLARRLSTGKTDAIGLVVPEIREPFFAELASAVEDEADRHGYTALVPRLPRAADGGDAHLLALDLGACRSLAAGARRLRQCRHG